jgi:hypothetical protein
MAFTDYVTPHLNRAIGLLSHMSAVTLVLVEKNPYFRYFTNYNYILKENNYFFSIDTQLYF